MFTLLERDTRIKLLVKDNLMDSIPYACFFVDHFVNQLLEIEKYKCVQVHIDSLSSELNVLLRQSEVQFVLGNKAWVGLQHTLPFVCNYNEV